MGAYRLIYIIVSINVDAAHELDQFPSLRLTVATGFIDIFANEIKGHIMLLSRISDTEKLQDLRRVIKIIVTIAYLKYAIVTILDIATFIKNHLSS
ncbi:hypothetical protein RGCCGE502_33691 (plasmid) [Rhizobium grahamii CCGE 502]|uniref:Uncharacterized protein n=1 Tax=Rhizobium grahamii CCGE 502 TaxID=990285 RepID=S3HJZ5_9HYPH|nr:hypothetical protein RGCCGE502_33691 [Rhizobium grahamii CCGE 502]